MLRFYQSIYFLHSFCTFTVHSKSLPWGIPKFMLLNPIDQFKGRGFKCTGAWQLLQKEEPDARSTKEVQGYGNDLSFVIADRLNIYEQQSTPSANMPLRDLFYVADILQKEHMDRSIYSNKPVKIPNPYFVVFYNGKKEMQERMELKLSDNFAFPSDDPSLELKVTVPVQSESGGYKDEHL